MKEAKPTRKPTKNQILAPPTPSTPSVKLSPLMTLLETLLTMIMEMVENTPHRWNTSRVSAWWLIEASRANHQPEKNSPPASTEATLFLFSDQSMLVIKSGNCISGIFTLFKLSENQDNNQEI